MRVFHLPQTKTSIEGEDISFAKQSGLSDPEDALLHHLKINDPPLNNALFVYRHGNSHRPLTKPRFISRLAKAARDTGMNPLQGHGIHIGSTLKYLLQNVPFEVVETKGHWHTQILTPFMQATPVLHSEFVQFSNKT
ncbi:hypothetical protein C8R48DRAFT_778698 [Suillus tomentosus]|nr:hypothetical protein C8R48DRAFT_778698 [Suillus tomentosus]